jgi:mannitol-1-phosphate 5-dehydrogenase
LNSSLFERNEEMKNSVIIGAGQTGRGFIAPILVKNDYHITFLDKNEKLIEQLNTEKEYKIEYFGDVRSPQLMSDFQAFQIDSEGAFSALLDTNLVFVSVLANNILSLIALFQKISEVRSEKLTIICCENGVDVKKPLVDAGLDAVISEGIIFCTTLQPDKTKLNLLSQDYPEIPIDGQVEGIDFGIDGMPLEMKFPELIQRKIYTYNFVSAIVSYFGSYKGYEVYGEAANDPTIAKFIEEIVPVITEIVSKEFDIAYQEQLIFTQNAVTKFQNRDIYDTIYRNAREAERKLSSRERLVVPLKLAQKYKVDSRQIELVTAAAIYYGFEYESLSVENYFDFLKSEFNDDQMLSRMREMFQALCQKRELAEIVGSFE